MGNIYSAVRIHAILNKKTSAPVLNAALIKEVSGHISQELKGMNCMPLVVNGMGDHMHLLFLLNPDRPLSQVMQRVMDASAELVRGSGAGYAGFGWQSDYGAFSVSAGREQYMFDYIVEQPKRHAEPRSTAKREFHRYLKHNGFDIPSPDPSESD